MGLQHAYWAQDSLALGAPTKTVFGVARNQDKSLFGLHENDFEHVATAKAIEVEDG